MMTEVVVYAMIIAFLCSKSRASYKSEDFPSRAWNCKNKVCVRVPITSSVSKGSYDLNECKMICGDHGSLWPQPKTSKLGNILREFHSSQMKREEGTKDKFHNSDFEAFLSQAWKIFNHNWKGKNEDGSSKDKYDPQTVVTVRLEASTDSLILNLKTDESYSLNIETFKNNIFVNISAVTYYGLRHGLESLSQLILYNMDSQTFKILCTASIEDEPVYSYRGLLLDTSRNFFSLSSIKRIISGMSFDKLNVLHWHIVDQQSFPFVSNRVPNLTYYGAYSKRHVYHPEEIRDLVSYGKVRGVMILPELDGPSHASFGWEWGPEAGLGRLMTGQNKYWIRNGVSYAAEPPTGQLNPANPHLYKILEDLYRDFLEVFSKDLEMFHMGGDEVNLQTWSEEPDIINWIQENFESSVETNGIIHLWAVYQEKARRALLSANNNTLISQLILWTSELTKGNNVDMFLDPYLYIIQIWSLGTAIEISELLSKNYRLIFSNYDAWYLDCGFDAWSYKGKDVNWCSPYKGWKTMYGNSPKAIVESFGHQWPLIKNLVLGGEVTMWSEQVDEYGVEGKIWPRTSAFAERVWREPSTPWSFAEQRLLSHRERMVKRGIKANSIMPEFCRQHDGWCYNIIKDELDEESLDNQITNTQNDKNIKRYSFFSGTLESNQTLHNSYNSFHIFGLLLCFSLLIFIFVYRKKIERRIKMAHQFKK